MALAAGQTGHLADHEEGVYQVAHGGTAGTTRPTLGSASTAPSVVLWNGTVEPTNATDGDVWWDESNSLLKVKVSGSFVASGNGTYVHAGSGGYAQQSKYTAGNITVNSTSLVDIATATDLTINAASGDLIEVGLNAWIGNEAVYLVLDVATVVSGSPVNYVSTSTSSSATNGISGWLSTPSKHHELAGAIFYTVQAGDVSSGTVTLRLRGRTLSATNRTINATANNALYFRAKNLG